MIDKNDSVQSDSLDFDVANQSKSMHLYTEEEPGNEGPVFKQQVRSHIISAASERVGRRVSRNSADQDFIPEYSNEDFDLDSSKKSLDKKMK